MPPSTFPSSAPTPAPSSPPASESFLSDIDGTAPSLVDTADYSFEPTDPGGLNLVSWKLDVNARAEDGVEKRGFNAISTVLNHPTKKANPLRSSRKPLPPLIQTPVTLPRIPPPSHYDNYLQTITPLYESFTAASSRTEPLAPTADLPPLDSVPELFFDPSFDVASPSTWTSLADHNESSLSSHLDTLERHLIHEITLRSSSFFSALSNLQDLHAESSSCLARIGDLQTSLKDVGSKQAQKGLEIIDAQERLRVLRATERNVRTVEELDELVKFAKGLVEAGDWAGGISCLDDIVHWWDRHRDDLTTLPALSTLPDAVTHLTTTISTQLQAALTSLLLANLSSTQEPDLESLRHSALPILQGLLRCDSADRIEDIWGEVMTTTIREGSRKHLPVNHAEEDGDEEGRPPEARGASLADSLKAMDHSTYLLLSTQMFSTMLSRLNLAQQIGEQLQAILSDAGPLPVISLHIDETSSKSSPPSLDFAIASACELANNRASKILGVRSEQHALLPLEEFVELFKENWDFVIATETLAKRMIVHLRGTTASQARAFLVKYHSIRLTQSANLVQDEQWTQIDVATSIQHVVDVIIEAAMADPAECIVPAQQTTIEDTGPAKVLTVEDKSFFVVKATAESLVLLGDYLKIVINLELVVTDVMSRIIEFLKSFNSRTCQVVLGAGAMRSAGLKNITAKHLALASQSLSVIVALIPYIREFIRRHLNPKQAVMLTEFDKLKRDYQEHQNEIHAKLVAIMSDRLAVHVGSLREIDWEANPDKDGPRSYAEMLVKETATLHKVLSKYLAPATVEGVLSEVLAAIVHRLSEEYSKIELKSDEGKKRMTQDVALIKARLAPLSDSGNTVGSLETLVRDKPTPRRAIGQAMRGMLNRVNSGSSPTTPTKEALKAETELDTPRKSGDEDEIVVEEPQDVGDVNGDGKKEEPETNGHEAGTVTEQGHEGNSTAVTALPERNGSSEQEQPRNDPEADQRSEESVEKVDEDGNGAKPQESSEGKDNGSTPPEAADSPDADGKAANGEKDVPVPPVPEKDTAEEPREETAGEEPPVPSKE